MLAVWLVLVVVVCVDHCKASEQFCVETISATNVFVNSLNDTLVSLLGTRVELSIYTQNTDYSIVEIVPSLSNYGGFPYLTPDFHNPLWLSTHCYNNPIDTLSIALYSNDYRNSDSAAIVGFYESFTIETDTFFDGTSVLLQSSFNHSNCIVSDNKCNAQLNLRFFTTEELCISIYNLSMNIDDISSDTPQLWTYQIWFDSNDDPLTMSQIVASDAYANVNIADLDINATAIRSHMYRSDFYNRSDNYIDFNNIGAYCSNGRALDGITIIVFSSDRNDYSNLTPEYKWALDTSQMDSGGDGSLVSLSGQSSRDESLTITAQLTTPNLSFDWQYSTTVEPTVIRSKEPYVLRELHIAIIGILGGLVCIGLIVTLYLLKRRLESKLLRDAVSFDVREDSYEPPRPIVISMDGHPQSLLSSQPGSPIVMGNNVSYGDEMADTVPSDWENDNETQLPMEHLKRTTVKLGERSASSVFGPGRAGSSVAQEGSGTKMLPPPPPGGRGASLVAGSRIEGAPLLHAPSDAGISTDASSRSFQSGAESDDDENSDISDVFDQP